MKLIELLRTLDTHTYVRINAIDLDKTKGHIICGETTIKGWTSLIAEITNAGCTDYTVINIHCLWHTQELYIDCMKM